MCQSQWMEDGTLTAVHPAVRKWDEDQVDSCIFPRLMAARPVL